MMAAAAEGWCRRHRLVFYPKSRFVQPNRRRRSSQPLPPFVDVVGLFVNATPGIRARRLPVPINPPVPRRRERDLVLPVRPSLPEGGTRKARSLILVQYAASFSSAQALLLDAFVDGYGGAGHVFDWGLIPDTGLPRPVILRRVGLTADNVGEAVRQVRPAAVDVSSGVEAAWTRHPGSVRIAAFIAGVRNADV